MEIIKCAHGHYYNPELYSECPQCAREGKNSGTSWFRQSLMLRGFTKPEKLASGSTGMVYRVLKDGKPYALKVIECGYDLQKYNCAQNEIALMKKLGNCRNVVLLINSEVLETPSGWVVLLLEPFITTFEEYYKSHPMTVGDVLQLGMDICTALEDCWHAGVAHLDVQPKNLYVDSNGHFCLGDFSSSVLTADLQNAHQLRGTMSYMAPEVYADREYSQASEIYALGMILYCLLNHGNIPFLEMGPKQLAVMNRLEKKTPVPSLHLGSALDQLLGQALAVDVRQRFDSYPRMRLALAEVLNPVVASQSTCKSSQRGFLSRLWNRNTGKNQPTQADTVPLTTVISLSEMNCGTLFDTDSQATTCLPMDFPPVGCCAPDDFAFAPCDGTIFGSDPLATTCLPMDYAPVGSCEPADFTYAPYGGTLFDSDSLASTCAPMPMDFAPVGSCDSEVSVPAPYGGNLFDSDTYATSCAMAAPCPGRSAGNAAAPRMSQVQFSAIAPKEARKEDYAIIQLFMYEQAFRAAVEEAIAMADSPVQEKRSGFQKVQDNTRVKIVLTCPDMQIDDNVQEQVWYGGYLQFDFAICPPENFKKRQILLTAAVYFNDIPATRLMLTIKALASYEEEIEIARRDTLSAFVSYASQDRNRVGALVQGMRKARPDMDIFFDVTTLRSGENWENTLYREILSRDILFLCWSRNAMASEWVEREWRYALERKGVDAIEPIPLEQPDICPPPTELWNKHFNDALLYIINR